MKYIQVHRPRTVVELGSGASTAILAQFLDTHDLPTRIVSVDHDHEFFAQTASRLSSERISLIEAPIVANADSQPWYDTARILDALGGEKVDLLIVDGPPEATSPEARKPVLTELRGVLAEDYTLLLDDAERPDEQAAIDAWLAQDTRLVRYDIIAEKGLTMLTTKALDLGALL